MKLPHEVSITVPDKTNPIKISELPVVLIDVETVSYTHLTLPTIYSV